MTTLKAGSCVENRLSDYVERSGAEIRAEIFYYGDWNEGIRLVSVLSSIV